MQMSTRYCNAGEGQGGCSKLYNTLEQKNTLELQPRTQRAGQVVRRPCVLPPQQLPLALPSQPRPSARLQPEDVGGGHVRLPVVLGRLLHAAVCLRLHSTREGTLCRSNRCRV